MTSVAGDGVDSAIDPVACKKITPVLHPPVVFGRVFNRGLKLYTGGMTITAKTLTVAECTDPLVLVGHQSVRIGKQRSMVVAFVIKRLFFEAMTSRAEFPSFPQFKNRGMSGRKPVSVAGRAGEQQRQ